MALYTPQHRVDTATIASGQTVSSAVQLDARSVVGFYFPVMTGTAVTISTSFDGTNYSQVYEVSTATSYTVSGTARYVHCNPGFLQGCKYIKITSNGAEGAARSISVISI